MKENKVSRKIQIMQTLAEMLEEKEPIKITTAELARRTNITEAAIYRHFPSKRKIYEEMVIFFESSIFPRIESMKQNHANDEIPGLIVTLILTFLETNKGFAKIINKQACLLIIFAKPLLVSKKVKIKVTINPGISSLA